MLTKSLLPLPEKYYGFGEDTENRFRNRCIDSPKGVLNNHVSQGTLLERGKS